MSGAPRDEIMLLDLIIALALGGAIGWERERSGKSAGLRTHMLVAMGAALFVALGQVVVAQFSGPGDTMRTDPLRILEAIVTGISFLGAGTIFVSRSEDRVSGLTTAATVWITAAIGTAVGLERHTLAIGSTVLVLLVLRLLSVLGLDRDDRRAADSGAGSSEGRP